MPDIFGLSRNDLVEMVERPSRAAQIYRCVYQEHATRFEHIHGIPAHIHRKLAESLSFHLPTVINKFQSGDGTRRFLLKLEDGESIESVFIPSADRATFCISSQIGCALACTFCLTGQMGLIRDLSTAEIVSQVMALQRENNISANRDRVSIVLMGMGEPLQNYANVIKAIEILHDDFGLKLPASRITLSTAGLIPGIARLAGERVFPNLSISLTGVTNSARNTLMPVNRRYPIDELMKAVRQLPLARQRRVMFECVMIQGLTDTPEDAQELARLAGGMPVKVNLIPLNPSADIPYERAPIETILEYQRILLAAGITTFIRKNRGNDVSGACGQLKLKEVTA